MPGRVGELPQTYETSADLVARAEWNNLAPRLTMPQRINDKTEVLYFKGATLGLKPNDPLLFVTRAGDASGKDKPSRFVRIDTVEAYFDRGLTKVLLHPPARPFASKETTFSNTVLGVAGSLRGDPPAGESSSAAAVSVSAPALTNVAAVNVSTPSSSSRAVVKVNEPASLLSPSGLGQVLAALDPRVPLDLLTAAARAEVPDPPEVDVYAFRVHSAPFGNNAPKRPMFGLPTRSEISANTTGVAPPQHGVIGYEEWLLGSNQRCGRQKSSDRVRRHSEHHAGQCA